MNNFCHWKFNKIKLIFLRNLGHALCIVGKPFNKIRFYGDNFIIFEPNVWERLKFGVVVISNFKENWISVVDLMEWGQVAAQATRVFIIQRQLQAFNFYRFCFLETEVVVASFIYLMNERSFQVSKFLEDFWECKCEEWLQQDLFVCHWTST